MHASGGVEVEDAPKSRCRALMLESRCRFAREVGEKAPLCCRTEERWRGKELGDFAGSWKGCLPRREQASVRVVELSGQLVRGVGRFAHRGYPSIRRLESRGLNTQSELEGKWCNDLRVDGPGFRAMTELREPCSKFEVTDRSLSEAVGGLDCVSQPRQARIEDSRFVD
eukprot:Gb_40691 [translate_table: standard]